MPRLRWHIIGHLADGLTDQVAAGLGPAGPAELFARRACSRAGRSPRAWPRPGLLGSYPVLQVVRSPSALLVGAWPNGQS
jgi:hypothetical protein